MKAKEYFSFTKRERSGIISLALLVLVVVIVPRFIDRPQVVTQQIPAEKPEELKEVPQEYRDTAKHPEVRSFKKFEPPKYVRKKIEPFEINTADTSAFIALPGIGSKLAARIILFRDKLGGFYNVDQISEVYGLQDSVFRKILPMLRCDPVNVKKIDINSAEKETLKIHPYIRWSLANALVSYRSQHGAFTSPDDLAKIENIEADVLKKMMPYISFK